MGEQIVAGKMIGGKGGIARHITEFFGGKGFYGIPCSATPKGGDPLGRIVHDYGYHPAGSYSINATHSCTTVKFFKLQEIAKILDEVT